MTTNGRTLPYYSAEGGEEKRDIKRGEWGKRTNSSTSKSDGARELRKKKTPGLARFGGRVQPRKREKKRRTWQLSTVVSSVKYRSLCLVARTTRKKQEEAVLDRLI